MNLFLMNPLLILKLKVLKNEEIPKMTITQVSESVEPIEQPKKQIKKKAARGKPGLERVEVEPHLFDPLSIFRIRIVKKFQSEILFCRPLSSE